MDSGVNAQQRPPLQVLHGQSNLMSDTTLAPPDDDPPRTFSQFSQQKVESGSSQASVKPQEAGTLAIIKRWLVKYQAPVFYVPRIIVTFLLFLAPYIFYHSVARTGSLTLPPRVADLVSNHPRITTYLVVTLSGIVASVVVYLFGSALAAVVQKRITRPSPIPAHNVKVNHLGRFAKIARLGIVLEVNYWAVIALLFFIAGNQLGAGIAAMFTPQLITQNTDLTGREIDLSSTNSECVGWYTDPEYALSQTCDYATWNGFAFTTCLSENQLSDVVQAGRDTAANSSSPITFPRMNGTRYLGSFPGVLLAGPNGLNVVSPVTPNDSFVGSPNGQRSYNYTLALQGVSIDVACDYQDTQGPINATQINLASAPTADTPPSSAVSILWTASCPPGTSDTFINLTDYTYLATSASALDVAMGAWACKEDSTNSSSLDYSIYFRGTGSYKQTLGNMVCTVNASLANYTVEYLGDAQYFRTTEGPTILDHSSDPSSVFANVFDNVVQRNVFTTIYGQTTVGNQVAEAVLAIASEHGLIDQSGQNDAYPTIMASVIQGMLNYEAGYLRLIYTGEDKALPDPCFRSITGNVAFPKIGWSIHGDQFRPYFVIAYTVVLLITLGLLFTALFMHQHYDKWDPTNPTDVCAAGVIRRIHAEGQPTGYDAAKEAYVNREA